MLADKASIDGRAARQPGAAAAGAARLHRHHQRVLQRDFCGSNRRRRIRAANDRINYLLVLAGFHFYEAKG